MKYVSIVQVRAQEPVAVVQGGYRDLLLHAAGEEALQGRVRLPGIVYQCLCHVKNEFQ